MSMSRFKNMLELRLDHAATPERVARATRLLADMMQPLLNFDEDESLPEDGTRIATPPVTVVVENYNTSATVRVWDPRYEPAILALGEFIANPSDNVPEGDLASQLGQALTKYAKAEAVFHPSFWFAADVSGLPRRLRSVDERFVADIERAVGQRRRRRHKTIGAAYVQSRIYQIGQIEEAAPIKVRLLMQDGTFANIVVDPDAVGAFAEAFATGKGREFRVKLVGDWIRVDGRLELARDAKLRAVSIDSRIASGDGLALVEAATARPVVRRGELAGVLRHLRGDDDDEDGSS